MNTKKSFLAALTAMCAMTMTVSLTSCSQSDNPSPIDPIGSKGVITVNPSALYQELDMESRINECLDEGSAILTDTLLIYDAKGLLVSKLGAESDNLQPLTFETGELAKGTYTVVAWQTVRGGNELRHWLANDEEQLSTVSISWENNGASYEWALGVASTTFTVDGGPFKASLSPKTTGNVFEMQVDGIEEAGYTDVYLYGPIYNGIKLDPSLSDADRWLEGDDGPLAAAGQQYYYNKFFTMAHGEKVEFTLCDATTNDTIVNSYHQQPGLGENLVYYANLGRLGYQPPFIGSHEDYAAWKADRDAGILATTPFFNWGCNIDEVRQHFSSSQWWSYDKDYFFYKDDAEKWALYYVLTDNFHEAYCFETEDGKNLTWVYDLFSTDVLSLEEVENSLLKQGYVRKGKVYFPDYDPRDIFFSADGKTEVQCYIYGETINCFFQATDPDDFQYIVPE